MDIISAYREVGSYRGAAAISGTTPKTVKRVIARHESGGAPPRRVPRGRNYDAITELVAERVEKSKGRITAKRLLPATVLGMQIQPVHRLLGSQQHGQLQLCVPPVVTDGESYRMREARTRQPGGATSS